MGIEAVGQIAQVIGEVAKAGSEVANTAVASSNAAKKQPAQSQPQQGTPPPAEPDPMATAIAAEIDAGRR